MADTNKKNEWIKTDVSHVRLILQSSSDVEFEKAAAMAYAVMFNTFDAQVFVTILADTVRYTSQMVLSDLNGKKTVADYLSGKLATIKKGLPGTRVFAELGEFQGHPCVVVAQGQKEPPRGVVLFSVQDKTIAGIDMCVVPHYSEVQRSGIYPESL